MKAALLSIIPGAALLAVSFGETDWDQTVTKAAELSRTGHFTQAEQTYRKALPLTRGFEKGDPRRAHTLNGLCAINYELGRTDEAEKHCKSALHENQQPASVDAKFANLESLHLLAALHMRAGRISEAERNLTRIETRLAELDPKLPHYSKIVGSLHYDRGFIDLLLGRLEKAESNFKKAASAFLREDPDHILMVACTLSHLSLISIARKRLEEGEAYAKDAIHRITSQYGPDHPAIARDLNNLAVIYLQTRRASEAVEPLRHAMALVEKAYGPEDESLGSLQATYAKVLRQLGRKAEAKATQKKADVIAARHQDSYGIRANGYAVDVKALANPKQ